MEPTSKPHINNLRVRLKRAFIHAKEHFDILFLVTDDGAYLLRAREYEAALGVLDSVVKDDRFTSPMMLSNCRDALVWYRRELQDGGYGLKSHEISRFVSELDTLEANPLTFKG